MTKLSVNINKVATIRNARGGDYPNLMQFAERCIEYGADGITIHPRPDQRHIRVQDVYDLQTLFPRHGCEFNIEGYPDNHFIDMVCKVKPDQVTLVPDPPDVLTSDSGWDTLVHADVLSTVIKKFHNEGIRVSLFMDTELDLISAAHELQADRIEFYTGQYFKEYPKDPIQAISSIRRAYQHAVDLGLEINAGHDLNLENLQYFRQQLPLLKEVSIGQWLISDCLYYGLQNTIPMYKRLLQL